MRDYYYVIYLGKKGVSKLRYLIDGPFTEDIAYYKAATAPEGMHPIVYSSSLSNPSQAIVEWLREFVGDSYQPGGEYFGFEEE